MRLIISSVVKGIDGRGIRNAGEGYINKNISLRSILKVISRLLTGYCFNYESKFNGVFSRINLSRIKDRTYVIKPIGFTIC